MDQITKRSNETFPVYPNFSSVLAEDETIASYLLTCVNILDGSNTLATIVDWDGINDFLQKIQIVLKEGTHGDQHKISIEVLTSDSNVYEKDILLTINDDPIFEFTKQPSEDCSFSMDFTEDLEVEWEDVIAIEVATIKDVNGIDLTGTMILGTISDEQKATVTVSGGNSAQPYTVLVSGTSYNGYVYSKAVIMNIEEF
jgi:hypothetical protein